MDVFENIISTPDAPTAYPAVVLVNTEDPTDQVRSIGYRIDPDGTVAGIPEQPGGFIPEYVNTVVLGWVAADWGVDPMGALGFVAAGPSGVDGVKILAFAHGADTDGITVANPTGDAVLAAVLGADALVGDQPAHGSVWVLTGGERTGEATTAPFVPVPLVVSDKIGEASGQPVTVGMGDGGTREPDLEAGHALATALGLTPWSTDDPDALDRDPSPSGIADVLAMLGITDGAVYGDDTDDDTDDDDADEGDAPESLSDDDSGSVVVYDGAEWDAFLADVFDADGPALGDDVYPDMIDAEDGADVDELSDDDTAVIVWSTDADHPGQGDDRA